MNDSDLSFDFSMNYFEGKETDKIGKVVINCESDSVNNAGEHYLKVVIASEFSVEEASFSDYTLNAISILYPYLRAYITNLTATAGIEPITLPPVNVFELLNAENQPDYNQVGFLFISDSRCYCFSL